MRYELSELPSLFFTEPMTNDTTYTTSPCVRLCGLDSASGLCRGCLRTLPEITGWGKSSETERQHILAEIEQRRAQLSP